MAARETHERVKFAIYNLKMFNSYEFPISNYQS
jgi:hypothetical protein